MTNSTFNRIAVTVLAALAAILLVSCGDTDPGLSRADVEQIVQSAVSDIPEPQPGLTSAEVERIVQAAIADIPQPEPGLTSAEVERIVQAAIADIRDPGLSRADAERIARNAVASIPPRSAPAEYTKFFVNNAVSRYETQGLEATLAHYNREESVDGQWYVFIIDENDLVIGHPDSERLGLDLNAWVGTDANGYNFGPEMLSATEEGKWVSYVYRNPESGDIASREFSELELKNVWVVRHDGLLFASGWYIDADEFTKLLVEIAVDKFRAGGLEETLAYFASPDSALAGLEAAIAYYNQAETVAGRWSAFIAADESGTIVAHSDPTKIGSGLGELFGAGSIEVTEAGDWVTTDTVRMWVAASGGYVFGSGWRRDESGG